MSRWDAKRKRKKKKCDDRFIRRVRTRNIGIARNFHLPFVFQPFFFIYHLSRAKRITRNFITIFKRRGLSGNKHARARARTLIAPLWKGQMRFSPEAPVKLNVWSRSNQPGRMELVKFELHTASQIPLSRFSFLSLQLAMIFACKREERKEKKRQRRRKTRHPFEKSKKSS